MTTPRTRTVKRPRIGDVIAHATGWAVVTHVGRDGLTLKVRDTIGRSFDTERARAGAYTRLTCETAEANHSEDILTIWRGGHTPTVMCGFHAQKAGIMP